MRRLFRSLHLHAWLAFTFACCRCGFAQEQSSSYPTEEISSIYRIKNGVPQLCYPNFTSSVDDWLTTRRNSKKLSDSVFNIAVLIPGLVRLPLGVKTIDSFVIETERVSSRIFMAVDTFGQRCPELCSIKKLQSFSVLSAYSQAAHDDIVIGEGLAGPENCDFMGPLVSAQKQWFKLERAFDLMKEFEEAVRRPFDAVLRARTDVSFSPPVDPGFFQELSERVVYSIRDIIAFANREVSELLFTNITARALALAGTDWALMPIRYDQLLESDLEDVGFSYLNYPCVAKEELLRALNAYPPKPKNIPRNDPKRIRLFKEVVKTHLREFQAAHGSEPEWRRQHEWCSRFSANGNNSKRFRDAPDCAFRSSPESEKLWCYVMNQLEPLVFNRRWPTGQPTTTGGTEILWWHEDRRSPKGLCKV